MEGTEEARASGTSLFPRVMNAVRREGQLPSAEQKANQNVTGSMDPSLGISVSLQTETSWLNEHNFHKRGNSVCSEAQTPQSASPTGEELPDLIYKEEDLYSSLSEDLSDLSVLCDMEFSFEYKTCFEKHLNTLPSVGPPTILAYKRESSENDRILAMMKILKERPGKELCKFCRNPLKPFPVESTPYQDFSQEVFCCRQFRDMIRYLLKQQNYVLQNKEIELISVSPHGPYGSEIERQKAKEKIALRLRERHMAKVFESVVTEPTTFLEFGKPMKTISYQLSNAPPVGDNWTIVPEEADAMTSTDSAENELSLCDFTSEKMMPERFVEKYYRTGGKFLTMFPDGTAQIFYPSGNIAIIVVPSNKKEAICIVQEDKDHNAEILAIFGSSGKATCYHPNGMVWMNINPVGGQYLDSAGRRVRRWHWKSSDSKQPCVQFKPIFISLNLRVGVRIIAQDKIYVSFLAMGKQAKFSVGRKKLNNSQLEDIEMDKQSITTSLSTAEDEFILFAIKIKFLSLLNKCNECLHSPSKKQWDRLKPPSFLVAQAQKLIYLCSVCDISTDVSASVQDTLRNYLEDIEMDKQSITTSLSTAEDEFILFAIKIKFLSLLNKCNECLHSPSKKQWDRLKPPSFLVAQAQKLIYLCSVCDISTDVSASVQDTLRNYVEDIEMDKQSITTSLSTAEDELILFAIKIKFLSLLNKCNECLHSPSKKQWDRLKPPSFLVAQAQKLIYLCSVCDISTDVSASVQDTLRNYVEDIEMDKQSITTSLSTAEDELILFAIKIKFLSLLNKCNECLHSPSKKQWDRLKPPSFLVAQAQKLIYLCSVCDISTDVSASVQDTLRNYVTCDLLT